MSGEPDDGGCVIPPSRVIVERLARNEKERKLLQAQLRVSRMNEPEPEAEPVADDPASTPEAAPAPEPTAEQIFNEAADRPKRPKSHAAPA